jgi:hypothetical protein
MGETQKYRTREDGNSHEKRGLYSDLARLDVNLCVDLEKYIIG